MNKFRSFFYFLGIVLLIPTGLFAQDHSGYEITAHLGGLKDGEKVTMLLSDSKGHRFSDYITARDSAYVKNGNFTIRGVAPDGPRFYLMVFDKHVELTNGKALRLYISNGEHIKINSDNIEDIHHGYIEHYVSIEGSPTNYSMMCLIPLRDVYYQSLVRLRKELRRIKDSVGYDRALVSEVLKTRDMINSALYTVIFGGDIDPEVKRCNLFLVSEFEISGHASFWTSIYKSLDEKQKNSFVGQWLADAIKLSVGQVFPTFKLPTPDGSPLSLDSVVARSKLTIVHFWGDESFEREKYQSELKRFYKTYHDKGLNIVGVSSDKYGDQWRESIKKHEIPWYNVSDLKGVNGIVDKVYHEYSENLDQPINNTTNVLLDSNGKILAWDVDGAELQWYLQTILDGGGK